MAHIELKEIAHSYTNQPEDSSDYALKRLSTIWEDGGAYALLGPSGCGKTTLLNIISGLLRPTEGKILFNGMDVTDLKPEERNIAQVFQFPVIYDTMTVYNNLAFPLRNRKIPESDVRQRVHEIADMLELTPDLDKRASGLAADAKQKISLGRGLVRSDVAAIMFDEPLTVIDPHLKWRLRRKLRQVHERFKLTLIYVTHDQMEALTFADKVVIMTEGEVVQLGTPEELFENPAHKFVGYFIGSPGMNFMPCQLDGNIAVVDGMQIPLDEKIAKKGADLGGKLELGIRPQYLGLKTVPTDNGIPASIQAIEDLGNLKIVTTKMGPHTLRIKLQEYEQVQGEKAWLFFPPELTKLFSDGYLVG